MSPAVAAFLLLAVALVAGLVAYERTRPPARVLALVGTLAALAALGRIAFAPLPNVKPTTDIVLIAGTALGSAAGFAVGAVAALVSNLFFGQGPWTPWQMAGWGLCGLIGAGLGVTWRVAFGRLPGRFALAGAGVLAAFVFGACVDFGTAATAGSDHLWSRFAAMYFGSSLPWNLAHAGGNVVFALVFGPALLRAVARFRTRFTVRWRPAVPAATGAVLLTLLLIPALALARATPSAYLAGAQHGDGGWGASAEARSSSLYTAWAALAGASGGVNPLDQRKGGHTPVDLLRGSVANLEDTGEIERTMLVLGSAGVSPQGFGGRDLHGKLLARRRREGSFDGQIAFTAFGILALRATGTPASAGTIRSAAAFLARQQEKRGGWNFYRRGGQADVDDTGAVLQALAAAGRRTDRGRRAAAPPGSSRQQQRDGGFAQVAGGSSNSQSTAFAVQGLVAAGRDPDRVRRAGRSPLAYLRAADPRATARSRYSAAQPPDPGVGHRPGRARPAQAAAADRRGRPPQGPRARTGRRPGGPGGPGAAPSAAGSGAAAAGAAAPRRVRRTRTRRRPGRLDRGRPATPRCWSAPSGRSRAWPLLPFAMRGR